VQRPAGEADHRFDRYAGHRGAQRRSPRQQIIHVAGNQSFDADRRLHLNLVDI
jgi:hypothetical protein